MTLEQRVTAANIVVVSLLLVALGAALLVVTRSVLVGRVDAALTGRPDAVGRALQREGLAKLPGDARCRELSAAQGLPGGSDGFFVAIQGDSMCSSAQGLPRRLVRQVGAATPRSSPRTIEVAGHRVRIVGAATRSTSGDNIDLLVAGSLKPVDGALRRLSLAIVGAVLVGIAVALQVGRLAGSIAIRPVRRLSSAVDHIVSTRDLATRVQVDGRDDLARLGGGFNHMLGVLEQAREEQRRLVADVSHELRTPLTSIRSNIEMLAPDVPLQLADREEIVRDVVVQVDEMQVIISDLVELARDREAVAGLESDVDMDALVGEVVERARRTSPQHTFTVESQQWFVRGDIEALARALSNLLSNAAKYSAADTPIEIVSRQGIVTVRDHGPGFDEADLPYVFDRFYRAAQARALPGSGLGLAIVRRVADSHGGSVRATNVDGGGALITLELPAVAD